MSVALLLFGTAHALGDDPAGAGLDLLVLVDRSGSMSSHSPAAIVDALPMTLNVLTWSARHARVKHRFGVVSFGSRAQVDVPLTVVDAETLPQLRTRIATLPSQSMGNTNFISAFETAADALQRLPADSRRRRAIVVLTDGQPTGSKADQGAALDRLVASRFPTVAIAVLLFGTRGEAPLWRRIARDSVHRVTSDRREVLATLHRVVTATVGTRSTQQSEGTLVLPPYLELVVFDIFRGSAKNVAVLPPDASTPLGAQTPGVEEMRVGDVLSTIIVRRPAAGAWTFRKSDPSAQVKILSQQFFPRGVLVEPPASPPVRQHDAVRIGYRLDDEFGRPLQELPGYPLSVDVSLAFPDGRRAVMPMARDSSALYRTSSPAECSATGRYWTEVLVTTIDSDGQPVRVFEDRWSGFSVESGDRPAAHTTAMQSRLAAPEAGKRNDRLRLTIITAVAVPILTLLFLAIRRR